MSLTVRHPDTIPGLAPDCRRLLLTEYSVIQARMSVEIPGPRKRISSDQDMVAENAAHQRRVAAHGDRIAAAIAEYRRVAKLWGVDVG